MLTATAVVCEKFEDFINSASLWLLFLLPFPSLFITPLDCTNFYFQWALLSHWTCCTEICRTFSQCDGFVANTPKSEWLRSMPPPAMFIFCLQSFSFALRANCTYFSELYNLGFVFLYFFIYKFLVIVWSKF